MYVHKFRQWNATTTNPFIYILFFYNGDSIYIYNSII